MPATVALERCDSYDALEVRETIQCALEPLGGMRAFVRPGARVLLKPNYIMPREPGKAVTTHPSVIFACAELVRACGGHPFVGDSPAWGTAEQVARVSGLVGMAKQTGLPIVTLKSNVKRVVRDPDGEAHVLRLSRDVVEADLVINLPKWKAHQQMLMTVALKNVFGCVAGRRKAWLHMKSRNNHMWFARMLVRTCMAVAPGLTIVDGIVGMDRTGPGRGDPKAMGVVIAGTDCVAIDRIAVELIGLDWHRLFTLVAAGEMGVGETDLEKIQIVGCELEKMRVPGFRLPEVVPVTFSPYRVARGWVKNIFLQMRGEE
jgi:uncharacterized protein (DUF362 family)